MTDSETVSVPRSCNIPASRLFSTVLRFSSVRQSWSVIPLRLPEITESLMMRRFEPGLTHCTPSIPVIKDTHFFQGQCRPAENSHVRDILDHQTAELYVHHRYPKLPASPLFPAVRSGSAHFRRTSGSSTNPGWVVPSRIKLPSINGRVSVTAIDVLPAGRLKLVRGFAGFPRARWLLPKTRAACNWSATNRSGRTHRPG